MSHRYAQSDWTIEDDEALDARMFAHLELVSRAYQVLYALGEESATVRTLTGGEARCIVGIVSDLYAMTMGRKLTQLDAILMAKLTPAMMKYVATGGM